MVRMILNGKQIAVEIVHALKRQPRPAGGIVALLVGNDQASESFIKQKQRIAAILNVQFRVRQLPATSSQTAIERAVRLCANDHRVRGIIVQLPLPLRIKPQHILDLIPATKDIDVLSSSAFGKFATGRSAILPPVVAAIAEIAERHRILLKGVRATVIGSGKLVGLPAAIWLSRQGATVSLVNEWTQNLNRFTKDADILVCGAGKPGLIKGNMIKRGAVVFDAGYGIARGKPVGDCDFASVAKKARLITPVPGGIGPLTVAMLFKNFYDLDRPGNR